MEFAASIPINSCPSSLGRAAAPWRFLTALVVLSIHLSPCRAQGSRDPLIGAVTAPDGSAIVGAMVEVTRAGGRGTGLLDLGYKNDFRRVGRLPTGRHGRFAMHVPAGLPYRVVVDHPPYAIWLRESCHPGEELAVRLQASATIRGTITGHDGKPATALVFASNPDNRDELLRGRTDDQGRYRFDRVPPGVLRLSIIPDRAPAPDRVNLVLKSGKSLTHDVRLERGVLLTGRVFDVATGKPIAGARIGEGWTFARTVTTDEDGRYRLPGYGSGGYRELHCRVPGYVQQFIPKPDPLPDPMQQDFELERGHSAAGRIVDATGKPLQDVYVQVFATRENRAEQVVDCIPMRTDAGGRFRTAGLREDLDHVLVVRQDGRAMVVYALPGVDAEGIKQAGDIELPRPCLIRGTLLDVDGKPMPYTAISIRGYNDDRHRLAPEGRLANGTPGPDYGKWGVLDLYVGRRHGRTDHEGRFAFGDIPPGTFHVVVNDKHGVPLVHTAEFSVPADAELEPLTVQADR